MYYYCYLVLCMWLFIATTCLCSGILKNPIFLGPQQKSSSLPFQSSWKGFQKKIVGRLPLEVWRVRQLHCSDLEPVARKKWPSADVYKAHAVVQLQRKLFLSESPSLPSLSSKSVISYFDESVFCEAANHHKVVCRQL